MKTLLINENEVVKNPLINSIIDIELKHIIRDDLAHGSDIVIIIWNDSFKILKHEQKDFEGISGDRELVYEYI